MSHELNLKSFPLAEFKSVIKNHLLIEEDTVIDVIVATVIGNFMNADPLWVLLIGPPSSGKTELLNTISKLPFIYMLSNLTPSTLISGKPKKNGFDPSLIYLLNEKIVIMKDFTTVLDMRPDHKKEILAQLREVYDGYYSKAFGSSNGDEIKKEWFGKIGFLGACTPAYDKHYSVIGTMGDRFLLYRCGSDENIGIDLGMIALEALGDEKTMREEMQEAAKKYFDQFKDAEFYRIEVDKDTKRKIATLAHLCAYFRCPVSRDRNTKEIEYMPQPEGPSRLAKQLFQLAISLTYARGSHELDESIYSIIAKISRDLMAKTRRDILEYLYFNPVSPVPTKDVSNALELPTKTALQELEDLMVLKVLKRERYKDDQFEPYYWSIRNSFLSKIKDTGFFE